MPPRSRASRFLAGKMHVLGAAGEHVVIREERLKRASAFMGMVFGLHPKKRADLLKRYHLHEDDDPAVRTDAVALVEQSTSTLLPEWVATWTLAEQDGVVVARSLHLEAWPQLTPPGGITSNLLRELSPAGAVAAYLETDLAGARDGWGMQSLKFAADEREGAGPAAAPAKPRGRPRLPDDQLATVAEAYLEEMKPGRPGVTRRVAQRTGLLEDTVRDRIRMCRQRGFLGPTKQGRRAGVAGPRLIEWRQEREANRR